MNERRVIPSYFEFPDNKFKLDVNSDFLIAEYTCLKNEILNLVKKLQAVEHFSLISSAALWTWLIGKPWNSIYIASSFLPILTTSLLYLYRISLINGIYGISEYLKKIEEHFVDIEKFGFEHHLEKQSSSHFKKWGYWFWGAILSMNVLFIIGLHVHHWNS